MPPRRNTVQRKLTQLILGTSLVLLALTLLGIGIYEVHSYRQTTARSLSTIAEIVAENSAPALLFDDEKLAQEILGGLHPDPEVSSAALFNNEGRLFATYPANLTRAEFPQTPGAVGIHLGWRELTVWKPVMQGSTHAGTIYFKGDLRGTYQRLAGLGVVFLLIATVCGAIAVGLYRYLRRRVAQPLAALVTSAQKITLEKDYSIRAHKTDDDEFGDLTNALNVMLDQIQASTLALNEQEERFRTLADNMVQLAWIANSQGEFLWYNKRWHDYTGMDIETSRASGWQTVHPDYRQRLEKELSASFASGREWKDTFPLRGANGEYRWFLSSAIPIRSRNGEVLRWFGTNTDVTELREVQQNLGHARDEAIAASRAKDDFLARLSHELRTPLSPVLLIASDACENKHLPEEIRSDFGTIKKNIEFEARLIDDLLDLTAIARGKLVLHRQKIAVNEIIRDAAAKVAAGSAYHTKIQIHPDPDDSIIDCDAVRVQQAVWNVLKNAVKFSLNRGTVVVTSQLTATRDALIITVTDEGIGMSTAELSRVFEAFAQGDHAGGAGSSKFGGLGLGLAIASKVIELHGGTIVASSPGRNQGSSFAITLPVTKKSERADAAIQMASRSRLSFSAPNDERSVLLVEDHLQTRLTLERLLTRRHFTVTTAGSVAEARASFQIKSFDLLISDIGLPDGFGYELIREFRMTSKIIGIALTGYGMEADISAARDAGFLVHLTKPIDVDSLDYALSGAMQKFREA